MVGEAEAWMGRLKCRLAGAQPAGPRRRGLVLVRLNLGHVWATFPHLPDLFPRHKRDDLKL